MSKLKFHQRTFDLLQVAPLRSDERRRALESAATEAGVPLPPSVIEWLSLQNVDTALRRPGQTDGLPLKSLLASIAAARGVRGPRLPFLRSPANIPQWAVELSERDDPPVQVLILDDDGRESWRTAADHFSDFVFATVWDNTHSGLSLQAQLECPLKKVQRFASGLEELPITKVWPTHKTFRFQLGEGRARVQYRPNSWSDIQLWAPTAAALASLLEHAAKVGFPRKAFFSDNPAAARLI